MKVIIPNPCASAVGQTKFSLSPDTGTMSMISFNNTDFWCGVRRMFHAEYSEEVTGVTVTEQGIQAQFNHRELPREKLIAEDDDCHHTSIYYSEEHDNFYCRECNKGMGQAYYAVAIGYERLRGVLKKIVGNGELIGGTGAAYVSANNMRSLAKKTLKSNPPRNLLDSVPSPR